jgi:hypothetical protein
LTAEIGEGAIATSPKRKPAGARSRLVAPPLSMECSSRGGERLAAATIGRDLECLRAEVALEAEARP